MAPQMQNAGLARITATLSGLSWWVGAGTGSGATKADNDVVIPAAESRALCVAPQGTKNVANDSIFITGTVVATVDEAITEYGIFDAPVAGNQILYVDGIGPFSLRPGDSVALMIDFTFV